MNPDISQPTEWDRECMAWHEAGHAVCSMLLPEREKVLRVSIEPGDEAFGFMQAAHGRNHNGTLVSMRSAIATELAGMLSERMFLRRTTTSGGADLCAAYSMARDMVVRFGMGRRTGLACPGHASDGERADFAFRNARRVEADIRDIIRACRNTAESTLSGNQALVRRIALALLEKKTLDSEALETMRSTARAKPRTRQREGESAWLLLTIFLLLAVLVVGCIVLVSKQVSFLITGDL